MDAAIDHVRLLADPTRAHLLRLVLDAQSGRATVTQLADALGLTQPTLSHHVKLLHDGGLLDRVPEGRRVWYSVPASRVDTVTDLISGSADLSPSADHRIVDDLMTRFAGTFGRETIERYVRESGEMLRTQGVERHHSSRTASFAADRLTALARADQPRAQRPEVLFVCVQNAGRSQIAAAILRQLAGDRVVVRTAGSAPVDAVRGVVVAALDEIGVPLGGEYPKPLTDEVVRAADVVVTMGCGDACPVYAGKVYLDWAIDDPAGRPLPTVRAIRDEINARVRELLVTLT
jgi:arsenate reductase